MNWVYTRPRPPLDWPDENGFRIGNRLRHGTDAVAGSNSQRVFDAFQSGGYRRSRNSGSRRRSRRTGPWCLRAGIPTVGSHSSEGRCSRRLTPWDTRRPGHAPSRKCSTPSGSTAQAGGFIKVCGSDGRGVLADIVFLPGKRRIFGPSQKGLSAAMKGLQVGRNRLCGYAGTVVTGVRNRRARSWSDRGLIISSRRARMRGVRPSRDGPEPRG